MISWAWCNMIEWYTIYLKIQHDSTWFMSIFPIRVIASIDSGLIQDSDGNQCLVYLHVFLGCGTRIRIKRCHGNTMISGSWVKQFWQNYLYLKKSKMRRQEVFFHTNLAKVMTSHLILFSYRWIRVPRNARGWQRQLVAFSYSSHDAFAAQRSGQIRFFWYPLEI